MIGELNKDGSEVIVQYSNAQTEVKPSEPHDIGTYATHFMLKIF